MAFPLSPSADWFSIEGPLPSIFNLSDDSTSSSPGAEEPLPEDPLVRVVRMEEEPQLNPAGNGCGRSITVHFKGVVLDVPTENTVASALSLLRGLGADDECLI